MTGIIRPERNCDFQAELYSVSLKLSNVLDALGFAVEGFHHHMPAVHFFDVAVDVAQVVLLLLEVLLRLADNHPGKPPATAG